MKPDLATFFERIFPFKMQSQNVHPLNHRLTMGSKMQVKGRCTFGRTRRFTAVSNADRLGVLVIANSFLLGGCKFDKVHLLGGCDYAISAKTGIL